MNSYLQNFYQSHNLNINEDENIDSFDIINNIEEDNMPTGWSSICFDETIHFYSDFLVKHVKD
uniref:Uncharacterized protein n=1 Tax=Caloglossa intermedia TaxID=100879 RepID=A0A1Z1M5R6_9FLOR|nr:hypothetical protein [Caloglossa intermedia]ARW61428.1 hypothetical protein [Caloglossa intermedia]